MNKVIRIFLLFVISGNQLIGQQKSDFKLNSDIEEAIYLNLEALSILDSMAETVWTGWDTYKTLPILVYAPENNAVFINPKSDIPVDFSLIENFDSKHKIYAREFSNISKSYWSTIILLDNKYYRVIGAPLYDDNEDHYYLDRVSELLQNEDQLNRIKDLLQSQEYYISVNTHESFHFHQKIKKYSVFYKTVEPRYYKKKKVLAYSIIEGVLLKKALYSENDSITKELVHQFLAVREKKSTYLTQRRRVYEKFDEYQEGTAQYIQSQIQIQLTESNYQSTHPKNHNIKFDRASDFLFLDSLNLEITIRDISDNPGHKHYFYGQTQARILDKLCGNAWKKEILNGDIFLLDLLTKYSDYNELESKDYMKQVEVEYDAKKILKTIRKLRFSKDKLIDIE